ncbi:hypothetical protein FA09DRAFT_332174 [Tilletiopsis washingtonensis]|uniref:DUF7137 domain-containing protein n=1 Tax=Tilletiopsis washingtonensis TaxID=58919 RepID=A0A316Z376_9BASI|nr:hypothetical protein FA09DRAFT_332174 [Tilletiopsis washingtonensis]PWN95534.1 hypothetical protein FA09DRAFT_332174 [Tilletiopsis washingtonensis]
MASSRASRAPRTAALLLSLLVSLLALVSAQRVPTPITTSAAANNGNNNGGNGNTASAAQSSSAAPAASSAASSSISIPQGAAAGGLTVTDPAQTADASYYKIAQGVAVTFGWNLTSLVITPTSLTVAAVNSAQSNTVTLGVVPGSATAITWSPWEINEAAARSGGVALAQATYRLQIYDERGLGGATNQAGIFNPNEKVQFALYIPQPYTSLADGWVCASCNAAASARAGSATSLSLALAGLVGALLLGGWA